MLNVKLVARQVTSGLSKVKEGTGTVTCLYESVIARSSIAASDTIFLLADKKLTILQGETS
jgi:hypothetical protein